MWWPESSLILVLNKSKQYQKLLVCIYLVTLWACLTSSWWVAWKVIGIGYLLIHGLRSIHAGIPTTQPILFVYAAHRWTWRPSSGGDIIELTEVKLLLNTGLFLLLRLNAAHQSSKILVIFKDQISENALRRLMWLLI